MGLKGRSCEQEEENMKVVILCGGKGTRLREKTESLPKALIEIGGRPILWHIMKIYAAHGFDDFVICLGYKGQMIKEYFMESQSWRYQDFSLDLRNGRPEVKIHEERPEKWKIAFADTGEETNTGGRIKKIQPLMDEDTFMVTYGDGVSDINIKKLLEFHRAHGRVGTVTAVNPPSQFGLLEIEKNGRVNSFREKPKTDRWINGGFFIFQKKFFDYLGENDVLEQAPLEKLSKEGGLAAYCHEAYWKCMDTYKDTLVLNEAWEKGKAPWKTW